MSRRAVVFGASGQLGIELVRELKTRGHAVTGFTREDVDITDGAAVENALAQADAEVVFNAAAYNQVDVAEKEPQAAFLVNALAVRNLALACRQVDARLVHFSTDYVFDGTARHPYAEDDPTHPLGAYAVSKLGRRTLRPGVPGPRRWWSGRPGVFGPGGLATARGNFVELMLRLAGIGQADPRGGRSRRLAHLRAAAGIAHDRPGGARPVRRLPRRRRHADLLVSVRATDLRSGEASSRCCWPPTSGNTGPPARRPKYSALSNAKMERVGPGADAVRCARRWSCTSQQPRRRLSASPGLIA